MKTLFAILLACTTLGTVALAGSVDDTLAHLRALMGTSSVPVYHLDEPEAPPPPIGTFWFIAIPGEPFTCGPETTGPAEFIRVTRMMGHTVSVSDTTDYLTGKVVETSLTISGDVKPFVMYRGLERCERALPSLQAAYNARHADQQRADAKYQ